MDDNYQAWTDLFSSNEKKEKIEDKVYCCTVCNDDQVRFTNAGNYASHMTIHKFHKGFDPTLPKPTAQKEFSLPKHGGDLILKLLCFTLLKDSAISSFCNTKAIEKWNCPKFSILENFSSF